jgi:MerR family transcriptional regulator, repressor of the yfmOP operon
VTGRRTARDSRPVELRIGEVAKLTGLTARTLRYWEELELLTPSGHRDSGERVYLPSDLARVSRIRDLQDLLGFSLAEVRAVLDADDVGVLDRVRSEWRATTDMPPARQRELLDEAIAANDHLLERLAQTQARIQSFVDEQAAKAIRLRDRRAALEATATAAARS